MEFSPGLTVEGFQEPQSRCQLGCADAAQLVVMQVGSLTAQVWHGAQGVVEAVREIRGANYQRQLDDLALIEKLLQLCEGTVANR